MRLLLGICMMTARTGAELFVRDLALDLNRRGHTVVVYAPVMGEMALELSGASIACVTDLASVSVPPDIIVGNTQVETVQCLARFPGVPAISICHDRTADHGVPPRFSRVRAHVAVDANCEERLLLAFGLPPERVSVIQNGVDTNRFRPRAPLPERPRRAAVFSNYATLGPRTDLVRQACIERGIDLDVIGSGAGNQARAPEDVLGDYDLVFAKARSAMEAMAVGCAVIVYDEAFGLGGMVRSAEVADWRRLNFGRKLLLRNAIELEGLRAAIDAYDAGDAARVSEFVRQSCTLGATADALATLAEGIVSAERTEPPVPPEVENREFATFVAEFLKPPGPAQVAVQVGILEQRLAEAAAVRAELDGARAELDRVYRSASWRITGPLRRVVCAARRAFAPKGDG